MLPCAQPRILRPCRPVANQNRYEGEWQDDLKHGEGVFFYLDKVRLHDACAPSKAAEGSRCAASLPLAPVRLPSPQGQCYKGVWKDGSPKCGEFFDLNRDKAEDATPYAIPEVRVPVAEGGTLAMRPLCTLSRSLLSPRLPACLPAL